MVEVRLYPRGGSVKGAHGTVESRQSEEKNQMKKNSTAKKLTLHKETVRALEQGSLGAVRGANSQNWSFCVSDCIPCDPDLTWN
jgi:hypothetical protein